MLHDSSPVALSRSTQNGKICYPQCGGGMKRTVQQPDSPPFCISIMAACLVSPRPLLLATELKRISTAYAPRSYPAYCCRSQWIATSSSRGTAHSCLPFCRQHDDEVCRSRYHVHLCGHTPILRACAAASHVCLARQISQFSWLSMSATCVWLSSKDTVSNVSG